MLSALPPCTHATLYSPKPKRSLVPSKGPEPRAGMYSGRFWEESAPICQSIFQLAPLVVPVDPLVAFVAKTLAFIWPASPGLLETFVHCLFTTFKFDTSTIYLAVIYCHRAKHAVDIRRYAAESRGCPDTSIALCGRHMFMGAILSAEKFLSDKATSNHRWSQLAGVGAYGIAQATTAFLKLIDYRLHIPEKEFVYTKQTLIAIHRSARQPSLAAMNKFLRLFGDAL